MPEFLLEILFKNNFIQAIKWYVKESTKNLLSKAPDLRYKNEFSAF